MKVLRYLKVELLILVLGIALFGVFSWATSGTSGSMDAAPDGYELVGADLEPFRSAFNGAAGDVRAVLLVGPT